MSRHTLILPNFYRFTDLFPNKNSHFDIYLFMSQCSIKVKDFLNHNLNRNAMKAKDNPETTETGRKKVEEIVRFWATFFIRVIGIRVHQKKVAYEEIYQKYLGKDYKMDLTDKDYSLVVCNHIGFYVTFFYNTFYRKLY